MTLTLSGLTFHAVSPSMLELVHDWPGVSILLEFNGTTWQVHYRDWNHDVTRCFKSREACVEVLASRRSASGAA